MVAVHPSAKNDTGQSEERVGKQFELKSSPKVIPLETVVNIDLVSTVACDALVSHTCISHSHVYHTLLEKISILGLAMS